MKLLDNRQMCFFPLKAYNDLFFIILRPRVKYSKMKKQFLCQAMYSVLFTPPNNTRSFLLYVEKRKHNY